MYFVRERVKYARRDTFARGVTIACMVIFAKKQKINQKHYKKNQAKKKEKISYRPSVRVRG